MAFRLRRYTCAKPCFYFANTRCIADHGKHDLHVDSGCIPLHADHVIESIITELCVVCPVKRHPKNVSWDVMFILAISAISNGAAEKTSLRSQPAFSIDSHFSADLTLSKIHAEEVHADNFAQRTS